MVAWQLVQVKELFRTFNSDFTLFFFVQMRYKVLNSELVLCSCRKVIASFSFVNPVTIQVVIMVREPSLEALPKTIVNAVKLNFNEYGVSLLKHSTLILKQPTLKFFISTILWCKPDI